MTPTRLTLRQLQTFAEIQRCGSTSAAARSVARSQSATSASLAQLEGLLKMKVFDRVGGRLLLNENGRMLLPQVLAALDAVASIERWAADDNLKTGDLRVGASTTIGNYLLPQVLARYRDALPVAVRNTWRATVMIANTAAIAKQVASFELDIGLIEGVCHESDLTVVPWIEDDLMIVAAPRHPILARKPRRIVPISALREATWLLREPGSGTREVTDQLLTPHLNQRREGVSFGNSEAIKYAAVNGLGIACLSRHVVADLVRSRELVVLNTPLPRLSRTLYIVMHEQKRKTRGMKLLLDTLMEFKARHK